MNRQRQSRSGPGEARPASRPDGPDINKDRLTFCLASLIGHKVTASLRNNVMYEGTFHSCALDSDYSITLKTARRLPSESNNKSGEVIDMLVISGKDFLQVSAMNVPPPSRESEGRKGFATDAEISGRDTESSRDLVPWNADGSYGQELGGLEDGHNDGKWDQFAVNEQKYGVSSTFNEEYYTTPLDKSSIPAEKREEADQIARQIEAGQTHAEVEDRVDVDGDGDEEARFGAAAPLANTGSRAFNSNRPLPQVPERPGQELANVQDRSGRKGMISEMKRINALNLEPTSAKHDDSNVRGGRGLKDPAQRNPQRMSGNNADLKVEFQQSLQVISQQEAKRNRKTAGDGEMGPWEGNNTQASGDKSKNQPGALAKAGDPSRQGFSFNPKAPAFSLNPQAGEFMPGGSNNAAANPAPAATPAKSTGPGPMLKLDKKSTKQQLKGLGDILEMFFQRAKHSSPESAAPDWPDAKGPSYKDVLGQPNPQASARVGAANLGAAQHMQQMQGGGWQQQNQGQQQQPQQTGQQVQQQQVPQQNAPPNQEQQGGPQMVGQGMTMQPMMPQAFVVNNASGGQQNQMQYGQMYGGPGQGQPHQGQGMAQPTIVFNQAGGMPQGGVNMVPMQLQNQQGQMAGVTAGGAMPKFGGPQQQMVVVPMMLANTGQYGNRRVS